MNGEIKVLRLLLSKLLKKVDLSFLMKRIYFVSKVLSFDQEIICVKIEEFVFWLHVEIACLVLWLCGLQQNDLLYVQPSRVSFFLLWICTVRVGSSSLHFWTWKFSKMRSLYVRGTIFFVFKLILGIRFSGRQFSKRVFQLYRNDNSRLHFFLIK